jgi:hypothetical protein
MANYPQELAQDAVCQNHTGHMTVLWFLPTRPLRLNTNGDDDDDDDDDGLKTHRRKNSIYEVHLTCNNCIFNALS